MKKALKELMPYIAIFVVVMAVRTFIITPIIVDGASMEPTLQDGEMMLLYKLSDIKRNDIVVINNEQGHIVKRVIALPKETIEIKDNKIYINDKVIEDKYITNTGDVEKITLKSDEYFVLGDNRLVSKDSRDFGPVTKDEIMGTTNLVIYPFSNFGSVEE